jgi:hypothetical protein
VKLVANFAELRGILKEQWNAILQGVIWDGIDPWQSRIRRIELGDEGHIA